MKGDAMRLPVGAGGIGARERNHGCGSLVQMHRIGKLCGIETVSNDVPIQAKEQSCREGARRKTRLGHEGLSKYSAALIAGNATPEASAIRVLHANYCKIANDVCQSRSTDN